MRSTTPGRLLIDAAVPADLRRGQVYDKHGLQQVFQRLADQHPDRYSEVSHRLLQLGGEIAYAHGGLSFGLEHLKPARSAQLMRHQIGMHLDRILDDPSLSEPAREAAIVALGQQAGGELEKRVFDESAAEGNPLADQVLSGVRGNKGNIKSLRGGDLLYSDHRGQPIPVVVQRSYSEGLTPAEYWAGAYGARRGVTDVKLGVAQSGYISKQLLHAAHRLLVTERDAIEPAADVADRGLPVATADADNEGSLLARPAGGFPRNTVLTPRVLKSLADSGVDKLLVRSPIVGGPADGGVYGRDAGVREKGRLAPRGDYVGIAAANALGERATQMQLCLAAGTLVRMADWSVKPIEEITPGDMVLGADIRSCTFPVRVTARFDNGLRDCVETRFRRGNSQDAPLSLISTADHNILAITRRSNCTDSVFNQQIRKIPVGYNMKAASFAAVMPAAFDDSGLQGEPRALLLGLLLGDGCFTEAVGKANFSCADVKLVRDLTSYLLLLNLKLTKLQGHPYYYSFSMVSDPNPSRNALGQMCSGDRNAAKRMLKAFGVWGRYSYEKTIPDEAFAWDNASVAALIAGLWITDGSIFMVKAKADGARPFLHLSYASTSLRMVEQVRDLLTWRFGVHGSALCVNDYGGRKRPLYTLNICMTGSVKRFLAVIPLRGVKAEKAAQWRSLLERGRQFDATKCSRTRQSPVGTLPTYDLEVDHPDHLFVLANGLIVSNSSKHSGGVVGSRSPAGLKALDKLINPPQVYEEAATHAQHDGRVSTIVPAPQGGHIVTIHDHRHYVAPAHGLKVAVGDTVEAGDAISEGVLNPAEIVAHKGIGEGRRYLTSAIKQIYHGAGLTANRRNVELLARGLVNHVEMDAEVGHHLPGDVAPYSAIESTYEPRDGHVVTTPGKAAGAYLEKPVLHYSIGTKLRPSVVAELDDWKIPSVTVHPEPPPFHPVMVSARTNLSVDEDPFTRHLGFGLQKATLDAVHRSRTSDAGGTSFAAAMMDPSSFGFHGPTRGFDIDDDEDD